MSSDLNLTRPMVLILGDSWSTEKIAAQLAAEGLDAIPQHELSSRKLPSRTDPARFEKLRELFAQFRDISSGLRILHPGLTGWAERPELPTLACEYQLLFLGPSARVLSLLRNKFYFLSEVGRVGIPHLLLHCEPMQSVKEVREWARRMGQSFPFVLKTLQAEGSPEVFVVADPGDFEHRLPFWVDQLRAQWGEVFLFAERFLEGARKISVPFARFQKGDVRVFPFSDVSLEIQHQKVIEFCPVADLNPGIQKQCSQWVHSLAEFLGYVGVGVFEFLFTGDAVFLINGLPRLDSGFPIWGSVAGTSPIAWQLATAQVGSLNEVSSPRVPRMRDEPDWLTGMSLRIAAEDSFSLLPQPGFVYELSQGRIWQQEATQVEYDLNVQEGESIPSDGSGTVGMLFLVSPMREQLFSVAIEVLERIWIAGSIQTNERFLLELLTHPWVREGVFHLNFISDECILALQPPTVFLKTAAALCQLFSAAEGALDWVLNERWKVSLDPEDSSRLQWVRPPQFYRTQDGVGLSGELHVEANSPPLRVAAFHVETAYNRWVLRLNSWVLSVRRKKVLSLTENVQIPLLALTTGQVRVVLCCEGAWVPAHQPLLVLESCGRWVPHALPCEARVTEWKVQPEEKVIAGQKLAHLELVRYPQKHGTVRSTGLSAWKNSR